jgi:hypothetical protein
MTFPTIERGTYLIVRSDGTEQLVYEKPTVEKICKAIGTDTLDTVILTWANRHQADLVMSIDDNGYETQTVDHGNGRIELVPRRARLPVNRRASELYWATCKPEYRGAHQIVGDVVLARDQDFAK